MEDLPQGDQLLDPANQLKAMRADGCLTLSNFSCCQDVLRRVDKTYQAFFRRVKAGEKPGFPRYRSSRRYDSITFPSYGDGCRLLDNGKLRIQGAGHIQVKLHRPVEGESKTVTIKREAGRWWVCFSVEREGEPLPLNDCATGIDVGLNSFAVLADGTEIPNPRHYPNAQARLRRCQRKVSRRKKGGNRRRKAVREVQRAHCSRAESAGGLPAPALAPVGQHVRPDCRRGSEWEGARWWHAGEVRSRCGRVAVGFDDRLQGSMRRQAARLRRSSGNQPDMHMRSLRAQNSRGSLARLPCLRIVG